jgi:hypothetical protein
MLDPTSRVWDSASRLVLRTPYFVQDDVTDRYWAGGRILWHALTAARRGDVSPNYDQRSHFRTVKKKEGATNMSKHGDAGTTKWSGVSILLSGPDCVR